MAITPYFSLDKNIVLPSTCAAIVGDNAGNVYFCDNSRVIRKLNLETGAVDATTITLTTTNISGLTILDGTYGLAVSTGNNVERWTLDRTSSSQIALANGSTWASFKGQQIATNSDITLATNTNSGRITKYLTSTNTPTTIQPAWLTGSTIASVISRVDSNSFFVGSVTGLVAEIDGSGNIIKNVSLPTTPNNGSAPTHVVISLAYYSDIMTVCTLNGLMYTYQWSTGTLLNTHITNVNSSITNSSVFGAAGGGGGMTFSDCASGVMLVVPGADTAFSNYQAIFLGSISASGFVFEDMYMQSTLTDRLQFAGVDYSIRKGWFVNRSTGFQVCNIPDANLTAVDTRSQYPIGTDVAYREIILQDYNTGGSKVIYDANRAASSTNTVSLRKNARYIAISIQSGLVDFRSFDT